jgi:hypothetical protein
MLDPRRPTAGLPRIPGHVAPGVLRRPGGTASRGGQAPGPSFECPGPAGGSGDPGAQDARRASPRAGVGGGPAWGGPMRPGPEWVSRLFDLLSGGETPGQPGT